MTQLGEATEFAFTLKTLGSTSEGQGHLHPKGQLDVIVIVLVVSLLLVLVHVHLVQRHHSLWSFSLATSPVVCAQLSSSFYVLHSMIES